MQTEKVVGKMGAYGAVTGFVIVADLTTEPT